MKINEEMINEVLLVKPEGRLDGVTSPEFGDALSAKLDQHQSMVVEFTDVVYVSSAGLRVILMAAKKCRQTGGKMVLCGLSEPIHEVFEISGFLSIIDVRVGRDEALREFGSA
jgi:anti-anti-sigma factor